MSLRATKGHAIILPDQEFNAHKGRIVIPDAHKPTAVSCIGTVVSMSGMPLTKSGIPIDPEFRPGNVVMYAEYKGTFIDHEGVKYVQVKLHDVLATIANERQSPEVGA